MEQWKENVMTKIKMLAAISGMAGLEEGRDDIDASTRYKHEENDLLNEIEKMMMDGSKDFSIGQCWNCVYRFDLPCCYQDEQMAAEGYRRCPEWHKE